MIRRETKDGAEGKGGEGWLLGGVLKEEGPCLYSQPILSTAPHPDPCLAFRLVLNLSPSLGSVDQTSVIPSGIAIGWINACSPPILARNERQELKSKREPIEAQQSAQQSLPHRTLSISHSHSHTAQPMSDKSQLLSMGFDEARVNCTHRSRINL